MTSDVDRGGVVVGVDGSAESLGAVDVAAREANLRGVQLLVTHGLSDAYLQYAERIVAEAVARAREAAPAVDVSGEVVRGTGAQALIGRSQGASLLVVGDRGLGAFTGLLLGSVAIHVATHATCPVLVVRGSTDSALPVLVAADGSAANDAAVGFAFEEASLRGAPLVALHVRSHPASGGPGDTQPLVSHETLVKDDADETLVKDDEAGVLRVALARWKDTYPHVDVRHVVAHGEVRTTIIDSTRDAQLAVVGARGHGGFSGLLLGSVSQAVLRHAACPTAVVRHPHGR